MAEMGNGYGSEFHLLRYLGRHRNLLNKKILSLLGYSNLNIDWLDYKFDFSKAVPDRELIGIEFLNDQTNFESLKESWKEHWPSINNAQNWDAICKIENEWILVEAKANKNEIFSNSQASGKSKEFISERFDKIKKKYGIVTDNDWNCKYYQKANRVLFLNYLLENGIKAKLLFIYFVNGYKKNGIQSGIKSKSEWLQLLKEQDDYLGIVQSKALKGNVLDLIIDIEE
jgi:hypothetical protein